MEVNEINIAGKLQCIVLLKRTGLYNLVCVAIAGNICFSVVL